MWKFLAIFMVTIVSPLILQANTMSDFLKTCKDPMERRRMSTLETAIRGPVYSSLRYDAEVEVTQSRLSAYNADQAPVAPAPLSPYEKKQLKGDFLNEVKYQNLLNLAQSITYILYRLNGSKTKGYRLKGYLEIPESRLINQVVANVCRHCDNHLSQRLKKSTKSFIALMKKQGLQKTNLDEMADEVNTTALGLASILESPKATRQDYLRHAQLLSNTGVGQIFKTGGFKSPLKSDPFCEDKKKCIREWKKFKVSPEYLEVAIHGHLQQINRAARDLIKGKRGQRKRSLDDEITSYFRSNPMAIIQAYKNNPQYGSLHCEFMAKALFVAGTRASKIENVNSMLYLAPMGAFWLIGAGAGAIFGLPAALPIAVAAIGGVTIIDLIWRKSNIRSQENDLENMILNSLNGKDLGDIYSYYKQANLKKSIIQDKHNLNKVMLWEGATLVAAGGLGRLAAYGAKNFVHRTKDLNVLYRRLIKNPVVYEKLSKMKITSPKKFNQWTKTAPKKEVKKVLDLAGKGFTIPMMLNVKELYDAGYYYPYVIRPVTGSAKDRVVY
jgi:hypothetical protein